MEAHMELLDFIETLSNEERELHKNLIQECVEREQEIKKYYHSTKDNLIKLYDVVYNMAENAKLAEYATKEMINHANNLFFNDGELQ
jgi:hypothetical protein